jgi:prolyl oligopeptidase
MKMFPRKSYLLIASCLFLAGCQVEELFDTARYPQTRKDTVVEEYFGVQVADPYRWLEDSDSNETQSWVAKQNKRTRRFLAVPAHQKFQDRITELWNYPRYSSPSRIGGRYFFWKNDGLQNQSIFYRQDHFEDEPQSVINPNRLSSDGTVSVSRAKLSLDGRLLAYGLSQSGSDWQEIKIRRVDSDQDYPETLKWCKFSGIAWRHDHRGFFYDRFPEPRSVAPEDRNNFNRVYWHELGTDQSQDPLIYDRPDAKELGFYPFITEDGQYLILNVYHGTDTKNRIYYRPVESSGSMIRLLDKADAGYDFLGNIDSIFYFRTDLDAPRGRIIAIDIQNPQRGNWREILPQQNDVIDNVCWINNHLIVVYMHNVHHQLKIYRLDGTLVREIPLPTLGTVGGLSGKTKDTEMFFSFTSFLYPTTIYRYDFINEALSVFRKPTFDFDPSRYVTKQVFYPSKDGTKIPMFITHKKGLSLNGENPTLLNGYGGFNISRRPYFSVSTLVWLEMGGVFALANMRGGGEYGEDWHQAGMLDKKQNVFDDFIAAGQWLIENQYTNTSKLAIRGGSNGGLLVAACMLQRPDLFGAVVCQVPVIDMLRYHKFTVGRYWIPEYGNAENSKGEFEYLYAYSPLHNVQADTAYPPILVTSADTDDRVVPMHAKKFAATLQEKATSDNPILLRVETKAGHGGGKPTAKRIEELADIYTFLYKTFDMKINDTPYLLAPAGKRGTN